MTSGQRRPDEDMLREEEEEKLVTSFKFPGNQTVLRAVILPACVLS